MKNFLKKLKKWNNTTLDKVLLPGYYFNKKLMRGILAAIVIPLIIIMFIEGFSFEQKYYIKCPDQGPVCENGLWVVKNIQGKECPVDEYLCDMKTFPPGFEVGTPEPWYFSIYPFYALFLFFVGIIWNHFKHNKGYPEAKK